MLRFDQPHPPFLPTGRHTQTGQEMRLAGPTLANQHHGLRARNVATVGELADLGRRHLRRLAEVEFVERLDARQMRVLQPSRDGVPFALVDLGREQGFQVPLTP